MPPNHRHVECLCYSVASATNKENIKAPHNCSHCAGNPAVTGGFPSQRASNDHGMNLRSTHDQCSWRRCCTKYRLIWRCCKAPSNGCQSWKWRSWHPVGGHHEKTRGGQYLQYCKINNIYINTTGDRINQVQHSKYYGCWCPGSLRRQVISIHDIDYVEPVGICLTWGRISTMCIVSMWNNDINVYICLGFLWKKLHVGVSNTYRVELIWGNITYLHFP